MYPKGRLVVLLGDEGGGKQAIARSFLLRIPHTQAIQRATTASPKPGIDLPGEYEHIAAAEFQRRQNLGEFVSPGWEGSNRVGIKKSSINEVLYTKYHGLGILILKPSKFRPQQLEDLQNFIVESGNDLADSLVLIYIVPPSTPLLLGRLAHKPDPASELTRRANESRGLEYHAKGAQVPLHHLYNQTTLDDAVARISEILRL